MRSLPLARAFTLIEPGPVVLVATRAGRRDNVMTISWTMVMDFTASFAITTGPWNYSFAALQDTRECVIAIPTVDMIDTVIGGWAPAPAPTPTSSPASASRARRASMSARR